MLPSYGARHVRTSADYGIRAQRQTWIRSKKRGRVPDVSVDTARPWEGY